MLGEAGATVYCTGRSTRVRSAMQNRPESIEDTAQMVTDRGGVGIALRADHTKEPEIQSVVDRIYADHGHLDLLVNDIWGGDELTEWGIPFWEADPNKWQLMFERGIHTHLLTSKFFVPLLLQSDRGLIVELTDGDHFGYRTNLYYDLVKTTIIRLAFGMAKELQKTRATAVAVTPGFMRSEAVLDHFGVTEDIWRDAIEQDSHFAASETPFFVGRAVAALAADPEIHTKAGRVYASWDLAREYGFSDMDGSQPYWPEHLESVTGRKFSHCDERFYMDYWEDGANETVFPDWLPEPPPDLRRD
jgi:NAD(P)-dependent dehydrogenase (short-subunit alcohol dehydrogenase family)